MWYVKIKEEYYQYYQSFSPLLLCFVCDLLVFSNYFYIYKSLSHLIGIRIQDPEKTFFF